VESFLSLPFSQTILEDKTQETQIKLSKKKKKNLSKDEQRTLEKQLKKDLLDLQLESSSQQRKKVQRH